MREPVEISMTVMSGYALYDKGAVREPVEISMTVMSGYALYDIEVIFQPGGLIFEQLAKLVLDLQGRDLRPKDIEAYHISGTLIDQIDFQFDETLRQDITRLTLTIPGFSRYTLGGDA